MATLTHSPLTPRGIVQALLGAAVLFAGLAAPALAQPTVNLSVSPASVAEGSNVSVTATLTGGTVGSNVTIPLTYTNGTAEAGDYTAINNLTISANAASGSVMVSTVDNSTYESDETFTVSFGTLPATVQAGTTTMQTVTITDAADLPEVEFSMSAWSATEGAFPDVEITVEKTGATELPATVNYATNDGTAEAGSDYEETIGTLTIAADSTQEAFFIELVDDVVFEADESFTVTLSVPSDAQLGSASSSTVIISDITDKPVVRITGGAPVTEGTAAIFTISAHRAAEAN